MKNKVIEMEEGKATIGIGMGYDYIVEAAMAIIERQRYFDECIRKNGNNSNRR